MRLVGPGEVPIQLMVNGKRVNLNVEPRVTLLNALRNRADLTGNKRGCDRGVCGACTMIIDGRTAYACSTWPLKCRASRFARWTASPTARRCIPCSRPSATATR